MKPCMKCGRVLPVDAFYRHPMTADGRLHKCKDCARADARAHKKSPETRRAYYHRTHEQSVMKARTQEAARKIHIVAPEACEACGEHGALERHHADYQRPLAIVWLCRKCHAIADHVRRAIERRTAA